MIGHEQGCIGGGTKKPAGTAVMTFENRNLGREIASGDEMANGEKDDDEVTIA